MIQTKMYKNNTYVAAHIRCFRKSPWNTVNNVFIAFTDEFRVAAIYNTWWNVSSFQDYTKLYLRNCKLEVFLLRGLDDCGHF